MHRFTQHRRSGGRRWSRGWRRGPVLAVMAAAALLSATTAAAAESPTVSRSDIVVEWNTDGTAAPGNEVVGHATVRRANTGIWVNAHMTGLKPGGVYTFWWIVVQDDGDFPTDIYVDSAGGTVVGASGTANAVAWAPLGDEPIPGFPALGDAEFASLNDTFGSIVRIEIAYHGQADDAGDDLDAWLADFWTGSECPPETPNPNPMQPHCPVYYAATFMP